MASDHTAWGIAAFLLGALSAVLGYPLFGGGAFVVVGVLAMIVGVALVVGSRIQRRGAGRGAA
ncbi:MAG: hypothetical protein ACYDCK_03290 [Thermoplasmatota archaeon]